MWEWSIKSIPTNILKGVEYMSVDRVCFAQRERNGRKICSAVIDGYYCNGRFESCPFYKTVRQQSESINNAYARTNSLPVENQRYISEKYFEGKYPWERENEI